MGKVKVLKFQDGERYPVLIKESGLPDFWVTLYVTANLRLSHAATSIENIIRDILHLRLWEKLEERDIADEFTKGQLLSVEDIHDLRDHCLLKTSSVRQRLKITRSPNVSHIGILERHRKISTELVSKSHFANRMSHIAHYLDFVARSICRYKSNNVILFKSIKEMTNTLLAQKRKAVRRSSADQSLNTPSPETFEQFMAVIHKSSSDNPFVKEDIRERNQLMFDILYESGVRSGELLALRITDIDYMGSKMEIMRRHNDDLDERSRQPVVKTLSRDVYISPELAQNIRCYILNTRAKIIGANKHPFLFVAHKSGKYSGRPISDAAFRNRILKPVIDKFPEFQGITRHGFRHNFNYLLSQKIDRHNSYVRQNPEQAKEEGVTYISDKEEIQIRKRLNGWASDNTAEIYNRRHIIEKTNKLLMSDMKRQLNKK